MATFALPVAFGVSEAKQQADATSTGKSFAQRVAPEAGIPRFAQIRPGLARGGEPDEIGLKYLRDRGYKTILSFLTDPAESAFVVQSGMKYIHIPMRSGPFSAQPPTDHQSPSSSRPPPTPPSTRCSSTATRARIARVP